MAVNTPVSAALKARRETTLKLAIGSREGVEAFHRILASGLAKVAGLHHGPHAAPAPAIRHEGRAPGDERSTSETSNDTGERKAGVGAGPLEGNDLERAIVESWKRVLGRDTIGVKDNFFELGGDSLTALQALALLKAALGREIPIVAFYEAPTVAGLARALSATKAAEEPVDLGDVEQRAGTRLEMMQRRRRVRTDSQTSVERAGVRRGRGRGAGGKRGVEMSAGSGPSKRRGHRGPRAPAFPGPPRSRSSGTTCGTVWNRSPSSPRKPPVVRKGLAHVKAVPRLEGMESFDASFFGFNPREAETMDPQIRAFLECSWHALESAGCDPAQYAGPDRRVRRLWLQHLPHQPSPARTRR